MNESLIHTWYKKTFSSSRLISSITRKRLYPQPPPDKSWSWSWSHVSSLPPPPDMRLHFIPHKVHSAFPLLGFNKLADSNRSLPTVARALSARQFLRKNKKSPYASTSMHAVRLEPTAVPSTGARLAYFSPSGTPTYIRACRNSVVLEPDLERIVPYRSSASVAFRGCCCNRHFLSDRSLLLARIVQNRCTCIGVRLQTVPSSVTTIATSALCIGVSTSKSAPRQIQ